MSVGIVCLAYLSVGVAKNEWFSTKGYEVKAKFSNCTGLRVGSPVMMAGVEIGRITRIGLEDYEASVTMAIQSGLLLQEDGMASIKTKGLIGEKYIEITPGADTKTIAAGGVLRNTEPALDIESLISKFVHGSLPSGTN